MGKSCDPAESRISGTAWKERGGWNRTGLLELAGIPIVELRRLSPQHFAWTRTGAHRLAGAAGISVPKAVVLQKHQKCRAVVLPEDFTYPLFVQTGTRRLFVWNRKKIYGGRGA